ncbi:MAG: arsenate reductase ArsC [Dehalococcoidia bacterium]|nr:arsenate reductase ArsC [Dehalococcoidia bacterium]
MDRTRVLFLCNRNTARSQMAEGLLRHMADDRFEAFSAGIEPDVIHPMAIEVMREIGIDISGQRSKSLQEYMGKVHFSYLITVCSEAERKCPTTFPGMGHRLFWDIADPVAATGSTAEKLQRFRQARDEISERLAQWIAAQS